MVDLRAGPAVRSAFASVVSVLGLVFLLFPLTVVLAFSLHSTPSLNLPFEGFSLRWYEGIFSEQDFRDALDQSLQVAVVVTIVNVVVGTAAAYGLSALPTLMRGAVSGLFFVPLTLPLLFIGLSLLAFFTRLNVELGFGTLVLGHFIYVFPFYVLIAITALERMDPAYRELGADLGANPWRVFTGVVLPQIWPVLAAGAALTFALSVDEFPISYWIAGEEQTVPLFIFSRIGRTIDPSINAVSALLMSVTIVALLLAFIMITLNARRTQAVSAEGG